LTLEDAVFGKTQEITVPTWIGCKPCSGAGGREGAKPIDCPKCQGTGQIRMQQGFFAVAQTCPTCQGLGQTFSDPCPSCRGQGRVKDKRVISVKIPAGVGEGDNIRLGGEGEAGLRGGPAGDLYVEIHLKAHDLFQREGDNLYAEVPISFATATLGGELDVPTLTGSVKLRIPPETQTGNLFRLREKGVKGIRSRVAGDLLCRIIVETPVKLTTLQKKMLQDFEQSLSEDNSHHSPKARSWFENVKKFFGNKPA
jgi:molecular chaperone DnaJ